MVILQIYVEGMTILETKGDPPITRYFHAPFALAATFQGVKPITGNVQFLDLGGVVQQVKNAFYTPYELWAEKPTVILGKEALQPFVLESFKHGLV
jgi:hypothetical protein